MAVEAREALWHRGIRLAIDDFGGGQINLADAITLRPDIVKLDPSLVVGIARSAEKARFVGGLISGLARAAVVVGKGVEQEDDVATLRMIGVTHAQGFCLGVPAAIVECRPDVSKSGGWARGIGRGSI